MNNISVPLETYFAPMTVAYRICVLYTAAAVGSIRIKDYQFFLPFIPLCEIVDKAAKFSSV